MSDFITGFSCCLCGDDSFDVNDVLEHKVYTCSKHLCSWAGVLDAHFDYAAVSSVMETLPKHGDLFARFWPLLGLGGADEVERCAPPIHAGGTPMFRVPLLEKLLRVKRVYIKDEGRNCSGSLKDRASATVVAHARRTGIARVATASTGNAAAALAASCAAAELKCVVFVPKLCPLPKVTQLQIMGATVYRVQGSYERALETCAQACAQHGMVDRTTAVNPLTILGKKTALLEALQEAPCPLDRVFVSVGDGNIVSSLHAALQDARGLQWLDQFPRICGVQARGSSACARAAEAFPDEATLADAWGRGAIEGLPSATVADSLSADLPRDLFRAVRAVRSTAGAFVVVDDEAIQAAHVQMARCGIFVEPSCAATLAGALQLQRGGEADVLDEAWLLMMTGTGLKDVKGAAASLQNVGGGGQLIDIEAGAEISLL